MDLCILAVLFFASLQAGFGYKDETYRCPPQVTVNRYVKTHGDSCYQFIPRERTWYGASADCRSRRGHLVTIRERSTQNFIVNSLQSFHWPGNGVWIGASDRQNEMDWRWVTNHRVKDGYDNWASGQPSCHIFCFEDCGLLRLDEGGRWHDYKCSWVEDYSYVCEYPLLPKTTTTTTTPTTTTTTTSTTTTYTTTTTTATTKPSTTTLLPNTTVNDTAMLMKMVPDVQVEMIGNTRMSKLEVHQDETANSTISIIVLVLGLVCGLILGLCIGLFIFRRRSRKEKEEEPSVFFSNPYYGDVRAPLNPPPTSDDFIDSTCCAGSTSYSQASTPVKRPLCGPPLPKRGENIYNPNPTLKSQAADSYNDITAQKLLYAAGGSNPPEEGAVGNVYDEADLVDHHYDYSTGENFYETVDNVRLAIHQNALNEQQEEEERYVPFQFDSPAPEGEKN